MADEKPRRKRRQPDAEPASGGHERPRRRPLSAAELAGLARRKLAEITGLEVESVTAVERNDDGSWVVRVELLELSRIPETDDLLGSYEVDMDESGELRGYRRVRRYARSQASPETQGARG